MYGGVTMDFKNIAELAKMAEELENLQFLFINQQLTISGKVKLPDLPGGPFFPDQLKDELNAAIDMVKAKYINKIETAIETRMKVERDVNKVPEKTEYQKPRLVVPQIRQDDEIILEDELEV